MKGKHFGRGKTASRFRAAAAGAVLAALVLGLAGCSKGGETPKQESGESVAEEVAQTPEGYVYVPEFKDLNFPEDTNPGNLTVAGGQLYWTTYEYDEETQTQSTPVWRRPLEGEGEGEKIPIEADPIEGYSSSLNTFVVCPDGGLFCFFRYVDENWENPQYFLYRFDAQGTRLFAADITKDMTDDDSYSYIQQAVCGEDGNLYAAYSSQVRVFSGEDGSLLNTVTLGSAGGSVWIAGLARTKEGKVYAAYEDYSAHDLDGTLFLELGPDPAAQPEPKGGIGTISGSSGNAYYPGLEKGTLVKLNSGLAEYDPETETYEMLLSWTDVDLVGDYVRFAQALEDGRILAYVDDYESDTTQLVYLTKTEAAKVPQKETIVVASLYATDSDMQRLVVGFNKTSDKYRATIRGYVDETSPWSETSYQDAVTAMNNDLTGGSAPDLLNLSYVSNLSSYAAKGVLEDLSPYLDGSASLSRGDFIESVLNGFTVDGRLISIPKYFVLNTLMGRTSQVGEGSGWTVDDVIALADANPDAQVIPYSTKMSILSTLLSYGGDSYIDYTTGQCHFDSPEFLKLLEFANRFPQDYDYDQDWSLPEEVQAGRLLLEDLYLSDITEFQMYSLMFGEPVNLIGYPTADGQKGNVLRPSEAYGILSTSRHKEGAWAFLEYMLQYEDAADSWHRYGFPSRKDMMDDMMNAAMEEQYMTDENGEVVLDENGEPMAQPKTTWGYDTFEAEIYAATQEQVDAILAAIDSASVLLGSDDTVLQIITEEAQAYFEGQKTAQEVAGIIQSRVQIYVDENS